MIRTTIRMSDYMHKKLLLMQKNLAYKSLNDLMIELLQLGYLKWEGLSSEKEEQFMYINSK